MNPKPCNPTRSARPVEELRRFPNLDNQKPEEKNDKNDPQVSQENEGVIVATLEIRV